MFFKPGCKNRQRKGEHKNMQVLKRKQEAAVCDATKVDSSKDVGYKKIISNF
jgi:hypothetical protein